MSVERVVLQCCGAKTQVDPKIVIGHILNQHIIKNNGRDIVVHCLYCKELMCEEDIVLLIGKEKAEELKSVSLRSPRPEDTPSSQPHLPLSGAKPLPGDTAEEPMVINEGTVPETSLKSPEIADSAAAVMGGLQASAKTGGLEVGQGDKLIWHYACDHNIVWLNKLKE